MDLSTYDGEVEDGRFQGEGTQTWGLESVFAGDVYSGAFSADKPNGQGRYIFANGDQYAGILKMGFLRVRARCLLRRATDISVISKRA